MGEGGEEGISVGKRVGEKLSVGEGVGEIVVDLLEVGPLGDEL